MAEALLAVEIGKAIAVQTLDQRRQTFAGIGSRVAHQDVEAIAV